MKIKYGLIIACIIVFIFSFLLGCSGAAEGEINQMLYSGKTSLKVTQVNLKNTIDPISKQKSLTIEMKYLVWNTTDKNLEILRICKDFKDGNKKRITELEPELLCMGLPRSEVLMTIFPDKNKAATFYTGVFLGDTDSLNYTDSEKIFIEITIYGRQEVLGTYKVIAPIPKIKAPKTT